MNKTLKKKKWCRPSLEEIPVEEDMEDENELMFPDMSFDYDEPEIEDGETMWKSTSIMRQ